MSVITNIRKFWERFEDEQSNLEQALKDKNYERINEIVGGLNEEVNAISGCSFFVEDVSEDFEMTIDPGPNKTSQYIAQRIKMMAPDNVKASWRINAVLQPLSQKAIEAAVQIKDETYTLVDFLVFYEVHPETQTFSTRVYCPGYQLIENDEYTKEMSMYLLELAIGQTDYEAYIDRVEPLTAPEDSKNFCNLVDFYNLIAQTVEKDHWKEYDSPLDIYSIYEPNQDFAHDALRKDMKIIFTTHPMLVEETLGEKNDVLLDLKAKEGEYGYMYYANPFAGKDNALFRQELSKHLDASMSKLNLGKVIGGAMGKSFSYIDWIVFDPEGFEKAFAQIKKQLDPKVELHYVTFHEFMN